MFGLKPSSHIDIDQLQWRSGDTPFCLLWSWKGVESRLYSKMFAVEWLFVQLTMLSGITIDEGEVDIDLQGCLCAGN